GRKFVNCPAAVSRRDWLNPLRLEVGEIFGRHCSTERLRGVENGSCNFTFVVDVGAVIGDYAQGLPEIAISKEFTNSWRFAIRQINALAFGIIRENLRSLTPEFMNEFRDGIAMIGVKDCRAEQLLPCQFAEAIVKSVPSRDSAGNRDRVDGSQRHLRRTFSFHVLEGEPLRGPTA